MVIFGAPKPYSTQCRERTLIRSRYGVCWKVAGSTGGKFPVVSPIAALPSHQLRRGPMADCDESRAAVVISSQHRVAEGCSEGQRAAQLDGIVRHPTSQQLLGLLDAVGDRVLVDEQLLGHPRAAAAGG